MVLYLSAAVVGLTLLAATPALADQLVEVVTSVEDPSFVESQTRAALVQSLQRYGMRGQIKAGQYEVCGYFEGKIDRTLEMNLDWVDSGHDLKLVINGVRVRLAINTPTVFVGSDMPICPQRACRDHELEHYVFRKRLHQYGPQADAALSATVAKFQGRVMRPEQSQLVNDELYREAYMAVDQVIEQFYAEMARLDARIDSAESYLEVVSRCARTR